MSGIFEEDDGEDDGGTSSYDRMVDQVFDREVSRFKGPDHVHVEPQHLHGDPNAYDTRFDRQWTGRGNRMELDRIIRN